MSASAAISDGGGGFDGLKEVSDFLKLTQALLDRG